VPPAAAAPLHSPGGLLHAWLTVLSHCVGPPVLLSLPRAVAIILWEVYRL